MLPEIAEQLGNHGKREQGLETLSTGPAVNPENFVFEIKEKWLDLYKE